MVDDDAFIIRLIKEILPSESYTVTGASNGHAAMESPSKGNFDVLLVDKQLPDMNGGDVCRHERGTISQILPIIVVTGSDQAEELRSSLEAGANDFVRKPFSPMGLHARVSATARTKRQTDQLESVEALFFAIGRLVEARDSNTGDHCSRLSRIGVAFGR